MGVNKRSAEDDDDCVITGAQPAKKVKAETASRTRRVKQGSLPSASHKQSYQDTGVKAEFVSAYDASSDHKPTKKPKDEEKRLRRWRKKTPQAWVAIRSRALSQRMFALDRQRDDTNPEHPTETISLAGTTGNLYTIYIDKVPTCNCPHAEKGNQCKHIAYVLSRVLRVRRPEMEYQLAFTSSELKTIFEQAPPLPSETSDESEKDGNRKPIEGECPICVVDFEPESGETILYCKGSCGNNIHAECFNMWKATKPPGRVTCPFCRAPWQEDASDLKAAARVGAGAQRNEAGYVNVASQLGLSGRRDYSSYNSYWMRQQLREGNIGYDEEGALDHEW